MPGPSNGETPEICQHASDSRSVLVSGFPASGTAVLMVFEWAQPLRRPLEAWENLQPELSLICLVWTWPLCLLQGTLCPSLTTYPSTAPLPTS